MPKRGQVPRSDSESPESVSMPNKRFKTHHHDTLEECRTKSLLNPEKRYVHSPSHDGTNEHVTCPHEPGVELKEICIEEVLEQDSRPTFVIDLLDKVADSKTVTPVLINSSLKEFDILLDAVIGTEYDGTDGSSELSPHEEFRKWTTSVSKFDDSGDIFPLSYLYADMLWTGSTVRKRWRIISGNGCYQTSRLASTDLSSWPPSTLNFGQPPPDRLRQAARDTNFDTTSRISGFAFPPKHNSKHGGVLESNSSPKPALSRAQSFLKSNQSPISPLSYHSDSSMSTLPAVQVGAPDWMVKTPKGTLSAYVNLCRSIDWGSSSLGPMESWGAEFRQLSNLMMAYAFPAALLWGDDYTLFYNESYAHCAAGSKHPALLGTPYKEAFPGSWDRVVDLFDECRRTGKSALMEDQMLPIERHGFLEETFFTWAVAAIYGKNEEFMGLWSAPFETTKKVIGERRLRLLRKLGEATALARTVGDFWKSVLLELEDEHYDVPLALLYAVVDEHDDSDSSSFSSNGALPIPQKFCALEGNLGIPEGHPAAPERLDLRHGSNGFVAFFREAVQTLEPTLLSIDNGTLPESLIDGIRWRGFEEPCRDVVILPVRPTTSDNVLAFLVLGINPRRAYDDDYRTFIHMLNRQLATSMASVILFQDDQKTAAIERQKLSMQLAMQTERMQRMTEFAPVGMFYIDPDGKILQANDRWFEITQHPRDGLYNMSWMNTLQEESAALMMSGWQFLTAEQRPWSGELQLKHQCVDPVSGTSMDCWILAMAQPEFAPDGSIVSIMGSIADISQIKWAQGMQARRLEEAEETRRQQNNFIDMTSHEMRNPLSAILQCSEDICTSLREQAPHESAYLPSALVENCIEAAETIAMCAQHQKGIVDDILTISKLDSDLLVITPIVVEPASVVRRAVKMFEAELHKKDIILQSHTQQSYQELNVGRVVLDPSRVLQVFINLMTNAIKFTQSENKRMITVRIGAFSSPPTEYCKASGFKFIPPKSAKPNSSRLDAPEWGTGEALYLLFEIEDTGRGLTEDEKKLLFQRFSQASPRTHAQYGGSGLGLFISRQLTELHGGQIGVSSVSGVGSKFAFYVKTKRSDGQGSNDNILESTMDPYLRRRASDSEYEDARTVFDSPSTSRKPIFDMDPQEMHILIVEDNFVNRRVLCKQLQKAGCTTALACHGEEALQHLKSTTFWNDNQQIGKELSVILMDLEMPVMDGLTCVRQIRLWEAEGTLCGHIPVIAVTANVRAEQLAVAKHAGMDDVISKPFRVPDLITKIGRLLSGTAERY